MSSIDPLDEALNSLLSAGWDEPAPAAAPEPEYPPLPVKGETAVAFVAPPYPRARKQREITPAQALATAVLKVDGEPAFPESREPAETDEDAPQGLFDIGLLTDLATGRKGAVEAAEAAGLTTGEVHSALATMLRDVDPKEIAKALGIQAAEQQLKSGALYGAVLHDLVRDMVDGRLKPDTKLELAKMLAKVGKIEPKDDKNTGAGGGFTLNISMGNAPAQPITINAD